MEKEIMSFGEKTLSGYVDCVEIKRKLQNPACQNVES